MLRHPPAVHRLHLSKKPLTAEVGLRVCTAALYACMTNKRRSRSCTCNNFQLANVSCEPACICAVLGSPDAEVYQSLATDAQDCLDKVTMPEQRSSGHMPHWNSCAPARHAHSGTCRGDASLSMQALPLGAAQHRMYLTLSTCLMHAINKNGRFEVDM